MPHVHGSQPGCCSEPGHPGEGKQSSRFFLFPLKNGRKRLAYGRTVEEAFEIMGWRMTDHEMAEISDEPPLEIRQQDIHAHLKELG